MIWRSVITPTPPSPSTDVTLVSGGFDAGEGRGELLAALRAAGGGTAPGDDGGGSLLAVERGEHLGLGPFAGAVAVDRHDEIALLDAGDLGGRIVEHVDRVGLAVGFAEQHADALVVVGGVLLEKRVLRLVVVAQVRILGGGRQRVQNAGRRLVEVEGVQAFLGQRVLDLLDALGKRVVDGALLDGLRGVVAHERRETERREDRRVAAHEKAEAEHRGDDDDQDEDPDQTQIPRPRLTRGRG